MLICSLCMALLLTGCDSLKYKKGVDAQEAGNYANAVEIFSELGEYKDSKNRISQCNYIIAQQEMEQGNYAEAIALFEVLGDYEDSVSLEKQCALDYGKALFGASDFAKAREQFNKAEKTDEVERYLRTSAWEMLRTYVENSGPITKEDESTELIDSKTTIDNYTLTSRQGSIMILAENAEKSNRKEYGFYLRIQKRHLRQSERNRQKRFQVHFRKQLQGLPSPNRFFLCRDTKAVRPIMLCRNG